VPCTPTHLPYVSIARPDPRACRTTRARALREAAGTLSGVALGEDDAAPQRDVLADVLDVFGGDSGLQWPALAERLAGRFPERWKDTTGDAVSAEIRARGVPSVDVKASGQARKGCRAADVETAAGR
jgi:DNA segregation ATPase FtsK/SpoIIIE, S-DNA-T family